MSRAIHNAMLINEDSDSSDFEGDIVAFYACVRKCRSFKERIDYFNFF